MPIYEYRCKACGHELEAMQKMSDPPLTECPECGEEALSKLVSAAGFRLKGSGWYETDFKSGNRRNLAGERQEKKEDKKASEPACGAGACPACAD
ncbi:MAG TPA: zinc ribbon domain-containing protein [Chromatiales bacterium]|nr:zinc ribbon domain-containing protein [Chromatiales bacterium]